MFTEKIQLEEDEKVLRYIRKHWFILTVQFISVIVAAILPSFALTALFYTPVAEILPEGDYTPYITVFYTAWLIVCWMMLFSIWTNHYLDVWTVTNKRLITVDQQGLFHRDTGSFRLERLQDINVSVRGILATFLKFGDLHAETASGDKGFVARGIPDPQEVKALILEATDQLSYSHNGNTQTTDGT